MIASSPQHVMSNLTMARYGSIKKFLLISSMALVGESSALDSCKYILRANFVALDACPNQDVGLCNISMHENDNIRWTWFFGDNRSSDSFSPPLSYPDGNHIYTITLKAYDSSSGCRDSISKYLKVYANPYSEFKTFIKTMNGCQYRQFAAYKTNPIEHSFHWFMPNGDSFYITGTNYFSLPDTLTVRNNTVKLRVRSNLGCISETERAYNLLDVQDLEITETRIANSNPSSLQIETSTRIELLMLDALGRIARKESLEPGFNRLDNLEPGIYYLFLTSENGKNHTYKTIVY